MTSVSHLLYPDAPIGPHTGLCALCGYHGAGQYSRDILDLATSNITALFETAYHTLCAPCYGVWSKPKHWHRAIYATQAGVQFPVISRDSVTTERQAWSDIFRQMDPITPRAIVLTADAKKRVWPHARVSVGDNAWIYVHDPSRGVSGNRAVSIQRLRAALDLIESAYSLGFAKAAIASSLFGSKQATHIGLDAAISLDARLDQIRDDPEFLPALIIAQKNEDTTT